MVSSIKYSSFKKAELFRSMNFNVLVAAILVIIFIAAQPSITLFSIGLLYVASGPLMTVWRLKRPKTADSESHEANKPSPHP